MDDLQVLGGELDIDQPAGRTLQVPKAAGGQLLGHQGPHLAHGLGGGRGVAGLAQGHLDVAAYLGGEGVR